MADVRRRFARPKRRSVDLLVDVNREISQRLRYDVRMEPGVFEPDETLSRGHGSCRDFAWLEVQILRRLGFAARFVSGYSIQLKPDVVSLDGPSGVSQDVADLHAWVEAYLPGAGWIGFDATSGLMAGEGHIPLAATAVPSTAAPVTGSYTYDRRDDRDRVVEDFTFEMKVRRLAEEPRVTKPYRDDQWQAIDKLGQQVDADLGRLDVRLTMGGEPTFVSIDDRDADEWNTAAVGPSKRVLGDKLLRRLRARFAPGRPAAPRAGQVVPGRAAAALGVLVLLPPRRRPGLAGSGAAGGGKAGPPGGGRRRAPVRGGAGGAAGHRVRAGRGRLRGRLLLPVARATAAGQRRRAQQPPGGSAGASPAGARVRRRGDHARRLCAAAARAPGW